MPAVDKSVVRLLPWRRVASICFGLFWLPWPYLPRSDVIRSHSARAVRHYESRVYLTYYIGYRLIVQLCLLEEESCIAFAMLSAQTLS